VIVKDTIYITISYIIFAYGLDVCPIA